MQELEFIGKEKEGGFHHKTNVYIITIIIYYVNRRANKKSEGISRSFLIFTERRCVYNFCFSTNTNLPSEIVCIKIIPMPVPNIIKALDPSPKTNRRILKANNTNP